MLNIASAVLTWGTNLLGLLIPLRDYLNPRDGASMQAAGCQAFMIY